MTTPQHIPKTASSSVDLARVNPFSATAKAATSAPPAKATSERQQAGSNTAKSADTGSKPAQATAKKQDEQPADPRERLLRGLGDVGERLNTLRQIETADQHADTFDAVAAEIDALRREVVDAQAGAETAKAAKGAQPAPMHVRTAGKSVDTGKRVPVADTGISDIGKDDRVDKRGDGQLDLNQLTGIYV